VLFPLDVLMVDSSMLAVTTDSERLTCGGFYLGETICFGSLEFIIDCFGSLSFSRKGSDSCTIFVGTTCSRSPSLHAMIEDSTNEFYMTSSREGSSGLLPSWRRSMRALPAPITTTAWPKDALTTQTMMMVPPWTLALRLDTGLPLE
jgi:hypothetical protein